MTDAYHWSAAEPPEQHNHAWTRVYRKNAKETHILQLLYSAHPYAPGSWDDDSWYGTGNQEEYEQAATMPLCPKCFVMMELYQRDEKLWLKPDHP